MNLLENIKKETQSITKDSFKLTFDSEALEYRSLLSGFNRRIFNLFNSHYLSLKVTQSIQDLFSGKKINRTENQSALHHVYRDALSQKYK